MSIRTLFRRSPVLVLFAAAVIAMGVAACSGDDDDSPAATSTPAASAATAVPDATAAATATESTSSPDPTATAAPAGDSVVISVGESDALGKFLVGPNGHTLYVFLRDSEDTATCVDNCAGVWPPLLLKDGESVEGGTDVDGTLGTIDTAAGTQVTYRGAPLYYYAADTNEGDTTGNLVGNVWFLARPETASTYVVGLDEEGPYLVGPNGMSLYVFANDTEGVSNCNGGCLQNWPALAVPANLEVTGADELTSTVATITRDDGTLQVTYNGMPLYYFAGDKLPGDTKGNGVGGVWSLATP